MKLSRVRIVFLSLLGALLIGGAVFNYHLATTQEQDSKVLPAVKKPASAVQDTSVVATAQPAIPATNQTQTIASTSTPKPPTSKTASTSASPQPAPAPMPARPREPLRVTSVSVHSFSYCAPTRLGYNYEFNSYNAGGILNSHWEYEITAGPENSMPNMPFALTNYPIGDGTVRVYDNYPSYEGNLARYSSFSYRARLHVTSPNDIVSNWIDAPGHSDPACN